MDTSKMASNVDVTPNKEISVKNENDDAEINAMALKLKESYRKNALAAAKQLSYSPAKVYANRDNGTVTLAIKPITTKNTQNKSQEELPKNCVDAESRKARFSWKSIAGFYIPCIIRLINGEHLNFVSTRMAETHLLCNYLHYLHSDIYKSCTSVKCHFITDSEAKLLNDINYNHTNCVYGKEMFVAGKDFITRLEDVHEFYTFLEVCYKKLLCNISPNQNEICGFIRINSESVVPYYIKDSQKYVPLFYFEGETENLTNQSIKLENWNLAYLKFCCKVQGIRDELFDSDSCTVILLDDIKHYFPPDTHFEEYWPAKVVDTLLLTNQKSTHVRPSNAWIRAPSEVVPAENTIPHTLTTPSPVVPQRMPMIMNTYRNGWPANQLVNSYSTQAQLPPSTYAYSIPTRNQSMAAQRYNVGSTMKNSQRNILTNSMGSVVPPPPLVLAGSTSVIGPRMTTVYNPTIRGNVVLHSNQIRQLNGQCAINNSQAHQQFQQQQIQQKQFQQQQQQIRQKQFQQQQIQQKQFQQQQIQQQQQQQRQIITTLQTQQSYRGNLVYDRFTNTQQRNTFRNVRPITVATEIVDLITPPSSPVPLTVQNTSVHSNNVGWELTRIPNQMWTQSTLSSAYKIQKMTLQGQTIHCINAKPYMYSDLMVTLDDLVQMVLPSCTVARCAHLLNTYLKTTIFSGNSEQLAVLRDNGRLRSICPEDTPMAMLKDIARVFMQLKSFVLFDEQVQQLHRHADVPSKRQRNS